MAVIVCPVLSVGRDTFSREKSFGTLLISVTSFPRSVRLLASSCPKIFRLTGPAFYPRCKVTRPLIEMRYSCGTLATAVRRPKSLHAMRTTNYTQPVSSIMWPKIAWKRTIWPTPNFQLKRWPSNRCYKQNSTSLRKSSISVRPKRRGHLPKRRSRKPGTSKKCSALSQHTPSHSCSHQSKSKMLLFSDVMKDQL